MRKTLILMALLVALAACTTTVDDLGEPIEDDAIDQEDRDNVDPDVQETVDDTLEGEDAGPVTPVPDVTVDMIDGQFVPADVEIMSGDTVRWRNLDPEGHSIQGFGVYDEVPPGEDFMWTFDNPGNYPYESTADTAMEGTVFVLARE